MEDNFDDGGDADVGVDAADDDAVAVVHGNVYCQRKTNLYARSHY